MFLSLLLVVVAIFILVLPWMWKRRHLYYLSWKLDGPFAWPIIGNALSILKHDGIFRVIIFN